MSEITTVRFEPKVRIRFTRAEVDALMLLSSRHYDGTCKAMSKQGGVIYGLNNCWFLLDDEHIAPCPKLDGDGVECTCSVESFELSFSDVDLMVKCCEMAGPAQLHLGIVLYRELRKVLDLMNSEGLRVNAKGSGSENASSATNQSEIPA